jgi:outer membrane protein
MRNLLLSAFVLFALPAGAATRVGVVDFEKLFSSTERARADRAELDKLMAEKQSLVDARKHKLDAASADLEHASATMDPVARAKREAELDVERAALRKQFEAAQTEVQTRERTLSRLVVEEAKRLMPELARARGLEVVLGAVEALMWSAPDVVQVDLTQEIARALDEHRAPPRMR